MRKAVGFLFVFLLASLAIITTSSGDETVISHQAHQTAAHGPLVASCAVCHAVHGPGIFADGQDLANTTVCDPCHSPGGAYDGVNDPNIGAKGNWGSGVYDTVSGGLLQGKEKWCVGCHDDDPSEVNGVSAPNIAGDDASFGYYKTGHGKHGFEQAITCLGCHDPALMHVDGEARTYAAAADNYQAGYRLKSVDSETPLEIPRPILPFKAEHSRLCFSCHDSTPFLNFDNTDTNFRRDVNDSCVALDPLLASDRVNMHRYHLVGIQRLIYDSDFDGVSPDSPPSCPACHNVHGPRLKDAAGITHAPAMIRTGELIGRESEGSLNLEYFINSCPDTTTSPTNELFDATGDSTGGSMIYDPLQFINRWTRGGVCGMCHTTVEPYWREAKNILSCETCHDGDLNASHTATPGSDNVLVFAAGQHDSAMIGDGEIYIACINCHTTNLFNIHGNNCTACHTGSTSPYESLGGNWAGGCQQGGCHTTYHGEVSDKHNEVTDYAGESNCLLCHGSWSTFTVEPSACTNCHAAYSPSDTTPPVTTSDVQPSYIGSAVIEFSMTDNGGKVGIGTFYSQIDEDAPEIGSSIVVDPVGSHTIEFWGVDQAGNQELYHNTASFEISADTTPPVTSSNAQEGATYFNGAKFTLTVVDNGTSGVKTTYYKINDGAVQIGTSVVIPATFGTFTYILTYWSEDWSGNIETEHNVNFTVKSGTGTIRLVWWDSNTNPAHAPDCDYGDWASWTVRRGGWFGPVVASGSGDACQGWDGIDDISVIIGNVGYYIRIDWVSGDWDDQTDFPNTIVDTPGEVITLHY
ncbi:MAG: hypothetical protein AMK70_01255 [Nitrospira bacterium SG8_35_1]|nr:MAG: hypothetical protein AMK70_01255 [Nitrospira bacterium SG8_35_1]